jgi:hypothetical protein
MTDNFKLTAPVGFMIFNRPAKTARVFEEIRRARPEKLFIIADGPRNNEEAPKCQEVRNIVEKIDWPCQVFKNYADHNLGCKQRFASGLDWLFQNVEKAIILEDDCLPDPSFFPFCQELLERFSDDPRVMQISGYNFSAMDKKFHCADSYYFSEFNPILGWATWRRAWRLCDLDVKNWPELKKNNFLSKIISDPAVVNHYTNLFDRYYAQKIDGWDAQWYLARWLNSGLSAIATKNLISNIGFDQEAYHAARDPNDIRAKLPVQSMTFPLIHPSEIKPDKRAAEFAFKYYVGINQFFGQRLRWFVKYHFPGLHCQLKKLKLALK